MEVAVGSSSRTVVTRGQQAAAHIERVVCLNCFEDPSSWDDETKADLREDMASWKRWYMHLLEPTKYDPTTGGVKSGYKAAGDANKIKSNRAFNEADWLSMLYSLRVSLTRLFGVDDVRTLFRSTNLAHRNEFDQVFEYVFILASVLHKYFRTMYRSIESAPSPSEDDEDDEKDEAPEGAEEAAEKGDEASEEVEEAPEGDEEASEGDEEAPEGDEEASEGDEEASEGDDDHEQWPVTAVPLPPAVGYGELSPIPAHQLMLYELLEGKLDESSVGDMMAAVNSVDHEIRSERVIRVDETLSKTFKTVPCADFGIMWEAFRRVRDDVDQTEETEVHKSGKTERYISLVGDGSKREYALLDKRDVEEERGIAGKRRALLSLPGPSGFSTQAEIDDHVALDRDALRMVARDTSSLGIEGQLELAKRVSKKMSKFNDAFGRLAEKELKPEAGEDAVNQLDRNRRDAARLKQRLDRAVTVGQGYIAEARGLTTPQPDDLRILQHMRSLAARVLDVIDDMLSQH